MATQCDYCPNVTTGRARTATVSGPVRCCLSCLAAGVLAAGRIRMTEEIEPDYIPHGQDVASIFGPDDESDSIHDDATVNVRGPQFEYRPDASGVC